MSDKPEIFILIHKLGLGGLTRAVLDQATIFTDLGHRTTILTLDPGGEQTPRVQRLREQRRLRPEVAVRNIHQECRAAWSTIESDLVVRAPRWAAEDAVLTDLHREDGRDNKSTFSRYFDLYGAYVALVRRHPTGEVWRIDTYRDRVAVTSEMFGLESELISTSELTSGKTTIEQWLSPAGTPYLSRIAPRGPHRRQVVERLPGPDGTIATTVHRSMERWQMAWVQAIVDAVDPTPIVLAESPSTVPKASTLRPGSAIVIGMLHNNQFDAPFRRGATLRKDHAPAVRSVESIDAMVVLTDQQREDLLDLCGYAERWHVVPNSTSIPTHVSEPEPGLVVLMTRLDALKAIHETIHAFRHVRDAVRHARLEIYGQGPAHASLQRLIDDLDLGDAVELRGRTDDPEQALARATATTITSTREAMPLGILEAHASATPVVSYDFSYGPAALISDGVDGYIVAWGDRQSLAERLIELLTDPDRSAAMGRAGRERVQERHSHSVVSRSWAALFQELSARRAGGPQGGDQA